MSDIWLHRWPSGGLDHFPYKPAEREHPHTSEFKQYIRASEYFRLEERFLDLVAEINSLGKRPEVIVGDDGYIDIDWGDGPCHVFSLSIGPEGDVACAGFSKTLGDMCCDAITPDVFKAISEFIEDDASE